jgi:hypothetical protein
VLDGDGALGGGAGGIGCASDSAGDGGGAREVLVCAMRCDAIPGKGFGGVGRLLTCRRRRPGTTQRSWGRRWRSCPCRGYRSQQRRCW